METEPADEEYEYDDTGFTREETELLMWEVGKNNGWEEMTEYDLPEPPADPTPEITS